MAHDFKDLTVNVQVKQLNKELQKFRPVPNAYIRLKKADWGNTLEGRTFILRLEERILG